MHPRIQFLISRGRYVDAETHIREELAKSITDEYLYYYLAITLLNQEKPKAAEEAAREAIGLDAEFDLGFYLLARCLMAQSRPKEALAAAEEAIRLDPYDADYFALKAQIFTSENKHEKSLAAAEAGLEVDPENENCRFFRSITLERLGRSEEADAESFALLADGPDDADNHCARGWILVERGETADAERHFIDALRINPESGDAKEGLLFCLRLSQPLLGGFLKIILWLERIPIWYLLLGLFALLHLSSKVATSDLPFPMPEVGLTLRVVVWTFFALNILIHPMFDLLFRLSKTARHALSHDARRAIRWYLVPVVISLVYLAFWCAKGGDKFFPVHAIIWAALARCIYVTFAMPNLWVRSRLTVVTVLVFLVAAWVEVYTYAFLLPELARVVESALEVAKMTKAGTANAEQVGVVTNRMKEFLLARSHFVHRPALLVWLLASFMDSIGKFLLRRAPDG